MNIKRNIHIALVTVVTTVGLAAPAMAAGPAGPAGPAGGSLSNGKPKPVVVWDHAAWKKCWAITYAQWREDGASPSTSTTAADWTCGSAPTK